MRFHRYNLTIFIRLDCIVKLMIFICLDCVLFCFVVSFYVFLCPVCGALDQTNFPLQHNSYSESESVFKQHGTLPLGSYDKTIKCNPGSADFTALVTTFFLNF